MSCIRLNLIDFSQVISGDVHGSIGDAVIAALSAEPETIAELELAVARFIKPIAGWSTFSSLHPGENFEPYDAGIVIVDLAARIVMLDSTYSAPMHIADSFEQDSAEQIDSDAEQDLFMASDEGLAEPGRQQRQPVGNRERPPTYGIRYHNGEHSTDLCLPYRIPQDWHFRYSVPEYEGTCRERRAERQRIELLDARKVLFGRPLCEFVAREILSAPDLDAEDLFTEIHACWLMSTRDDLEGTPREILLARKDFIDFDLHSRQLQWSFTGECPPSLLPTAHAYRFGGFGTHECVIYYDLIRVLLAECRQRAREEKEFSVPDEADRLERIKHAWLETPSHDYQGKAPGLVIEWERRRIPMAISGKDAMVDEDCPVCQAMAEDLESPFFWHLDGSEMDDRFEFSFCVTREEWEAERREWEEFSRKFDRKWAEEQKGTALVSEHETFAADGEAVQ